MAAPSSHFDREAFVHELGPAPDRALVQDTLEAETADTDVSDARVQTTTDAVMRAVRSDP